MSKKLEPVCCREVRRVKYLVPRLPVLNELHKVACQRDHISRQVDCYFWLR